MATPMTPTELSAFVKSTALAAGYDLVGIAPAVQPTGWPRFTEWLQQGFAGEMHYMPRREAAYAHPEHVMPGVRSVIMLAVNYKSQDETDRHEPSVPEGVDPRMIMGRVAQYAANGRDYHDLLKDRLRELATRIQERVPSFRTRAVVDTAPLLERDFARLAGLGWFGKNTMLIHKRLGSFFLLGALLTDAELVPDEPHHTSHCGTCTRCLEVCPTDAFPEPGVLDARKCLAYLTIELKGPIPQELRSGIGDWLFGCDLCQDVCPWNRKSPVTGKIEFQSRPDLRRLDAMRILLSKDEELKEHYKHTPLSRPGPVGLKRNAAMVLGNSRHPAAIPALMCGLKHAEAVVRSSCVWALGQIGTPEALAALKQHQELEDNAEVQAELVTAIPLTASIPPHGNM